MIHTLVVPEDLIQKLNEAQQDTSVINRWSEIGVASIDEMMEKIISRLNEKDEKLSLSGYRTESKAIIKEKLCNSGSVSKYLGYFENEYGDIDAMFFYNEPKADNGNDIATRNIWAALIGIYSSISDKMVDLHFTNRPVYIVNLNETNRLKQTSVKINILCSVLLGFHYIDLFDNGLVDVIPIFDDDVPEEYDPRKLVKTLEQFDCLVSQNQSSTGNSYYKIDKDKTTLYVLAEKLMSSSNPSAELYRFCCKVIPAVHYAKKEGYTINTESLDQIDIGNMNILKKYLEKFND